MTMDFTDSSPAKRKGYLLEIGRDAMACRFEVLLHPGNPPKGPEFALQALDTITQLEEAWSVYKPTSEISVINARAFDVEFEISESTKTLLALALEVHRRTAGAFDITSNRLSKIWGFYRRQGTMPTEMEISESLKQVGSQHIALDRIARRVKFKSPIEINPGGIGKGLALDMASHHLSSHSVEHYAFHGGKSSIRCRGEQSLLTTLESDFSAIAKDGNEEAPSSGWKIAVRHPEQTERLLGSLALIGQSLGTSGPANQFFYFKGKRFGHIIDPRTGWPSEGMLSITVLHPDAGWADALATGLFVMGIDRAISYCEENPDTAMLAILPGERSGQVEIVTCNMLPNQWRAA